MFLCARTEDLFVGVRSFKSHGFCASGMADPLRLLPPGPMGATQTSGLQAEAVEIDGEPGFAWTFLAVIKTLEQGGAAASSGLSSGSALALPATGPCVRCGKPRMIYDQGWDTGICNRCWNKEMKKPTCEDCGEGLWNPEAAAGFTKCCRCQRYECKYCERHLTVQEVRYGKVCCNDCYKSEETGSRHPCRGCRKLLPVHAKSAWCDWCWRQGW